MEQEIRQVELSVILECLGGRNMTKRELEDVKDFRNLAIVTTSKKVTTPKEKKKYFKNICCASSSVAAVAARASGQQISAIKTTAFLPEEDGHMAVDIGIFPTHPDAAAAYMYKVPLDVPYYGRCAWPWLASFMKVTRCSEPTGFWFPPSDTDAYDGTAPLLAQGDAKQDEKQVAARKELFRWAAEALLRQQRTHIFAFYVAGPWVRAFRFDRAGALASRPFHVVRDRFALPNLLFRLFCAPPRRQGLDQTATTPAPHEVAALEAFETDDELLLHYKGWMLNHRRLYPLCKVMCPTVHLTGTPEEDAPAERAFLIGRPTAYHSSLTGRCTRGYVAYDVDGNRLVFFKDQWRSPARHPTELETYRHLHAHKVQFIATPIAGGDVVEPPLGADEGGSKKRALLRRTRALSAIPSPPLLQETESHRHMITVPRRIHTRLVTKEIGRVLEDYKNAYQLLSAISYAIYAHEQAWEKAGVLHRDISIGNIMIEPTTNKGFLNDWDLARFADELDKGASEPLGISGTWPFKSALSLHYPLKAPTVADDNEAFIWLIDYMATRFHRHNYSPGVGDLRQLKERDQRRVISARGDRLSKLVHDMFYDEQYCEATGFSKGPVLKLSSAKNGDFLIKLTERDDGKSSYLQIVLSKAFEIIKEHYATVDYDALAKYDPENVTKSASRVEAITESRDAAEAQDDYHSPEPANDKQAPLDSNPFLDEGCADPEEPVLSEAPAPKPTGPGPLMTYGPLKRLLNWALNNPEMREGLLTERKYVDQFRGLPAFTTTATKGPLGGTSGKRKADAPPADGSAAVSGELASSKTERGGRPGKRVRIEENGATYRVRIGRTSEVPALSAVPAALAGLIPPLDYGSYAECGGPRRSRRLLDPAEHAQPPPPAAAAVPRRAAGTRDEGKGRATGAAKSKAAPALPTTTEETTSDTLVAASPAPTTRKAALPKEKAVKTAKIRAATKTTKRASTKTTEPPVRRSSRLANK